MIRGAKMYRYAISSLRSQSKRSIRDAAFFFRKNYISEYILPKNNDIIIACTVIASVESICAIPIFLKIITKETKNADKKAKNTQLSIPV